MREAVSRWAGRFGEAFARRLYTARLIGSDSGLILHGGGNVSLKGTHRTIFGNEIEVIYVKASGWDLAALGPEGLPGLDLSHLRRLRSLDALTDEQMLAQLRTGLLDASGPNPSIETLLHAFLPHRFIDHSHADAVLTLANQADGEAMLREALGKRVAIVPYVRPGLDLARAVAQCCDEHPDVEGVILLHHGLITFGDDARTAYERHIALVDACERFIDERVATCTSRGRPRALQPAAREEECSKRAERVAPVLRGLLAFPTGDADRPYLRSILEWRDTEEVRAFIDSAHAKELLAAGPLTGDHLIHTKPTPMFVENPAWSDKGELRRQLEKAVGEYRSNYEEYVSSHGGSVDGIDSAPRVVLLPGAGMFCWGATKRAACIAADIAEHTLAVKLHAEMIGRYASLPPDHLYDMEYRTLQRMKLDAGTRPPGPASWLARSVPQRALERHVVVISGGAGAIGAAVAGVCAEHGAHVAVLDLKEDRVLRIAAEIERRFGQGTALGLVMDVTDEKSVRAGFDRIVATYGGVDVVVPNAGIAHVAAIEDMDVADFRRVMEVNAVGYMLFMREGIRILKKQGLGGHIIINASKNVFGPGRDFGAYSASKAAGHQLGKVAAIELAQYGIRVNMINADAVFGDERTPSGLWATVGPARARSRNLRPDQLPEYYRSRNLLKTRVFGHHIGNAVVFFASNATPTTGATLPVDGGLVDAFPR